MPASPVLVATRSRHKLAEIRDLVAGLPVELVSPADLGLEVEPAEERLEVHETFAGNALAKARHFRRRSGLPTFADDSGLCVDALDGAPGVRTRRFAPEALAARIGRDAANNRHLLERLAEVPPERRSARYRCAVAAVDGAGEPFVTEGTVEGRIARAPRGKGGFGYDPLFVPEGEERTYAELPAEVKRRTSHRARAVRQLTPWLRELAEAEDDVREEE